MQGFYFFFSQSFQKFFLLHILLKRKRKIWKNRENKFYLSYILQKKQKEVAPLNNSIKKSVISIFLSIFILLLSIIPAFASSSVVEYGNVGEFIINPTDKDLFTEFKNFMPGDQREQKIIIKNSKENTDVEIFLKAEVDEEYKEFLSYITLAIYSSDSISSKGTLISENLASEEGNLKNWISLGKYSPNEESYITVELKVSTAMNNKFAEKQGVIHWIFTCEEKDTVLTSKKNENGVDAEKITNTTKKSNIPFTGSNDKMFLLFIPIILSGICISLVVKEKKSEKYYREFRAKSS